ncbi:phosphoadenosine phosphosulfate reductase domain-containing protein [Methanocaldococcus infernus]
MDNKFLSSYENEILKRLTGKDFKDLAVILEKIGGLDYRKKVYIGNLYIGILEFNLITLQWEFHPSANFYLIEKPKIRLKPTRRKIKGKKISLELIENPEELEEGYFGFEMGNYVGVGIKKGDKIKIKDLTLKREVFLEKLDSYIKKNKNRIEKLEKKAKNLIKNYKGKEINASFSGGKDSSVSTLLANEIIKDIEVIFIDTGLEFPETIKFVKDFAKKYDLNLTILKGGDFWEELNKRGVPTKDNRWCNTTCKLNPLREYLKKYKLVYTINGSRRAESFSRERLSYEKRGLIENQINVFPILDWKGIDVWSWIYLNDILYNPLYDKGFERIGCYLCPAMLNAEFLRVRELYPELFNKWVNALKNFGYSEEEILRGFWRWKHLPKKLKEIKRLINL